MLTSVEYEPSWFTQRESKDRSFKPLEQQRYTEALAEMQLVLVQYTVVCVPCLTPPSSNGAVAGAKVSPFFEKQFLPQHLQFFYYNTTELYARTRRLQVSPLLVQM